MATPSLKLTCSPEKPSSTLGAEPVSTVILAANKVGPGGNVIGLDILPEMIDRGRAFAAAAGLDQVRFIDAKMDDIPLPGGSVGVVISNGAINLAARKSRVLAEAQQVMRPGGRLCVSDLTIDEKDLPSEILTHPSAWAG